MSSATSYETSVATARQPGHGDDYRELVRLGSLAASSHNTQPWKFTIDAATIRVAPDFTRRCPVVDPDDAHLFKSLGCATENIVHAAAAQGRRADVEYNAADHAVVLKLTPDPTCTETELARAIPARQCTKAPYDGKPLGPDTLVALDEAGTGHDVRIILLTDAKQLETVTDLVNRGNQAQLSDPEFRSELISWIRPNDRESLENGDGLSGRTSGQPTVPTWLARRIIPMMIEPKSQSKIDTTNIASSAGIAVFVTKDNHEAAWVEVGRCYERLALTATALGIRNAFINQPIEVSNLRHELERWLGLDGEHAQLMIRFGTGPQMPYSIRRPLEAVIANPALND
jgi:hypothetical protein